MEENKEKKIKQKFIVFLIIAFLAGLLLGQFFLSPREERETSFTNFIAKIKTKEEQIDYNLFLDVLEIIKNKYVNQPISEKNLFYGALRGFVSGLKDPYSVFLEPEMAQKFKTELSGTFEGIGAEIGQRKGRIVIIAPLEDTPAARAGLKAGDEIYAINDEDTLGMSVDEAVSKIRGKRGTEVRLLIWRQEWDKAKEFTLVRDIIKIQTVRWEMKDDKIAYLKISYFNDRTINEFDQAIRRILAKAPEKLILDLRNNPGGYLYAATEIAGAWLGQEIVVFEKFRSGEEREHRSTQKEKLSHLATVVLVNKGSASGSEILAGALQDYQKAKILGEKTFGKGSVQELTELKDGSIVKLTTAHWLTPKKREIEGKGIEPDIVVEMTDKDYEEGKDLQLEKAIEILKSETTN
ncbi:MAG: S41 family peptidase [Patescibacteria group bacterium]|nr:S41 family peptidase [Patescibacteria group bacterium]